MEKNSINLCDIIKVYIRSFLYQNMFNTKNFQDFGFSYVLYPVIKKFKIKKKKVISELIKNYEYFNTNPVFASFVYGVALNLIERDEFDKIKRFKFEIMAPLAALGDAFIWATLFPSLSFLTISFLLLKQWWAVIILFLGYNIIANIFFRFYGIIIGYKHGINFIFKLARFHIQQIISVIKQVSLIMWGTVFYIFLVANYKIFKEPKEILNLDIEKLFLIVIIGVSIFFYDFLNKKFVPVFIYLIFILIITALYFIF